MTDLMQVKFKDLKNYMIDCHGFDEDEVKEWSSKADLVYDIKCLGHEAECKEYFGM